MHGCNNNERIQRRRTLFPFLPVVVLSQSHSRSNGVRARSKRQSLFSYAQQWYFCSFTMVCSYGLRGVRTVRACWRLACVRARRQKNGFAKLCLCGAIVEGSRPCAIPRELLTWIPGIPCTNPGLEPQTAEQKLELMNRFLVQNFSIYSPFPTPPGPCRKHTNGFGDAPLRRRTFVECAWGGPPMVRASQSA